MKRLLGALALVCVLGIMTPANATIGYIYQNATEVGDGYTAVPATKVGCATCKSFFHLVGLGNCSVNAAAKAGGIKTVAYYDVYTKNILGYRKITVKAYGN